MSKLFHLQLSDFWKGLFVAIIGSVLGLIYKTVDAGSLDFDWKFIIKAGVLAGLSYLIKNLATNSKGELFTAEGLPGGKKEY